MLEIDAKSRRQAEPAGNALAIAVHIFEMGSSVVSGKKLSLVFGRRKPFPRDIEHFRARSEALRYETSAECSVKNHKLFEGLMPES